MNRGLLSNVLDNNRPDFVLLNECFIEMQVLKCPDITLNYLIKIK